MANKNEIILRIMDETEDSRFSTKVDISNETIQSATKTKTTAAQTNKSTSRQIAKSVGTNVLNTATGGMSGQITSIVGMATNPVALALFAVALAQRAYNHVQDIAKRLNESDDLRLRAGGSTRGEVNQLNVRRNITTGRIIGGHGTYIRR